MPRKIRKAEVKIFEIVGRRIGQYIHSTIVDELIIQVYPFKSFGKTMLPDCATLELDFQAGKVCGYDERNTKIFSKDLLKTLLGFSKATKGK